MQSLWSILSMIVTLNLNVCTSSESTDSLLLFNIPFSRFYAPCRPLEHVLWDHYINAGFCLWPWILTLKTDLRSKSLGALESSHRYFSFGTIFVTVAALLTELKRGEGYPRAAVVRITPGPGRNKTIKLDCETQTCENYWKRYVVRWDVKWCVPQNYSQYLFLIFPVVRIYVRFSHIRLI